ncbi:MAG: DUF3365 domain-containing protein [Syntrophobacteraceae bacterium]|jgi:hypothetical protein
MSDWLQALPVGRLALVIFGLTYAITAVIQAVVAALARNDRVRAFKGLSPGLLPPLGIVFGLFVAFIASQVWSETDRASTAVNREASALSTVLFLASSFPGEPEARLRDLIRRHIQEAVTQEWPMMGKHTATLRITPRPLAEALSFTLSLKPQSEGQVTAQREITNVLENALDARRQRIIVSLSRVSWVKWACLLLQAACTLVAIAMVHIDNRTTSTIAMGIFATGAAISVLMVAAHNRPFSGGQLSISSDLLAQVMPEEATTQKEINQGIALNLAALLRAARAVISQNQDLIDAQATGKHFNATTVIEQAKATFAESTGHPVPVLDPISVEGRMWKGELDAIEEIMDEAQPLINDPKRGFKGFIPALFTYKVCDRFSQKAMDLAYLKLTAPKELIRHQDNLPDEWEDRMIKNSFQSAGWEKSKFVAEETELHGKRAYRLLIPEYYEVSCLSCHGEPKGATDISGGKKEGGKLGDLGGVISVAIYLK